jgi:Ser/Thr protein kinase RdoA (MazF antagonist)
MTHEEQSALCAQFHLGEPRSCAPLGGTRNHNFRLITSRGSFVARDRYIGYRDPARIAFDHAAIAFLHAKGAPVVPPNLTVAGKSFWQDGQRQWEVFPAVPGRHFRDGDPDDIRALAIALATFHQAGKDFTTRCNKLGARGETDPREMLDLIAKLRPAASAALEPYQAWITSASRDLPDAAFESLPHTLIHGDIQPANILIDGGRVTALVDLDWCDRRPRIYDIAFAILLCCATHESPIDGGDIWSLSQPPRVQPNLVQLFLQNYNEQGWPLEAREMDALRPQIILSWCHCRLAGAMKVEPARQEEFLARPPHDSAALFPDALIGDNHLT